ncbi:MAG: Asp-tRNA(Asn)/Glu-tRNA(Gln) amidotransferase subunit GatC [Alphaproteobacteria bacterium]
MAVDTTTVKRIARLARIAVSDEEAQSLVGELNTILDWVGQLDDVDTDGVEPMTSVVAHNSDMRADLVNDGDCVDAVLANAPQAEDGYFCVPKVVE